MGMFRRLAGYLRIRARSGVESRMDPGVQLEQAVEHARKQDARLREQAARVIAHRGEVQMKLDRAADDAAKARAQALQALRNADAGQAAGDAAEVERWTRAAEAMAIRLDASESMLDTLRNQYRIAADQGEAAKRAVNDNALELERLAAKRFELVGKLEQAKMQEEITTTLRNLNRPMDTSAPTIADIEDRINSRIASAAASAELESASIEGAARELDRSIAQVSAQSRLHELRAQLELESAPPPAALEPGPSAEEPPGGAAGRAHREPARRARAARPHGWRAGREPRTRRGCLQAGGEGGRRHRARARARAVGLPTRGPRHAPGLPRGL